MKRSILILLKTLVWLACLAHGLAGSGAPLPNYGPDPILLSPPGCIMLRLLAITLAITPLPRLSWLIKIPPLSALCHAAHAHLRGSLLGF